MISRLAAMNVTMIAPLSTRRGRGRQPPACVTLRPGRRNSMVQRTSRTRHVQDRDSVSVSAPTTSHSLDVVHAHANSRVRSLPSGPGSNEATRGWRHRGCSAENDADPVCLVIVRERDAGRASESDAVKLHRRHPAAHTPWILDNDVVAGGVITERDGEARPRSRDTGIDEESRGP